MAEAGRVQEVATVRTDLTTGLLVRVAVVRAPIDPIVVATARTDLTIGLLVRVAAGIVQVTDLIIGRGIGREAITTSSISTPTIGETDPGGISQSMTIGIMGIGMATTTHTGTTTTTT